MNFPIIGRRHFAKTVGGREYVLIGDDGTAAKELPLGIPQRHHPRIFVFSDFAATHDPRYRISNTTRTRLTSRIHCSIVGLLTTIVIQQVSSDVPSGRHLQNDRVTQQRCDQRE
ncbi:unnamed protein product [Aphis gossypii]|uniref:Uncharacterized protein n=1 Tax=Aphis gossypii TaxID=80765 RepID=A0A9P0J936_APHGO|nr:unnamed protein product [Aphis gossypii]